MIVRCSQAHVCKSTECVHHESHEAMHDTCEKGPCNAFGKTVVQCRPYNVKKVKGT